MSEYFVQGLAQSTQRTYNSALKQFYVFCTNYNVLLPFPVSERLLCYFAVFLAERGLTHQTVQCYLSAVRNMQLSMGLPDPRDQGSLPLLKRVQAGIKRVGASKGQHKGRVRLPITIPILRKIRLELNSSSDPNRALTWAVASVAFFGFFRLGELLLDRESAYTQTTHLSWGDVAADSRETPSVLRIHLKRSKCDQFGRGADVLVGRTGDELCPVAAVLAYLAIRGSTPGPLFIDAENRPLLKARFVDRIRAILDATGYPSDQFAGHSFRIGAATAAAQAGIQDSTIQALGRWNSAAFLTYIRTPKEELASVSAHIARAGREAS